MNAKDQIELVDATPPSNVTIDNKCGKCTKSICCNSINQKIPTPKSKEDFDHLLWQVSHENINVFNLSTFLCFSFFNGGVNLLSRPLPY